MSHKCLSGYLFLLLFSLILFSLEPQKHRVHGEENKPARTHRKPTTNDSNPALCSAMSPNVGQWLLYKVDLKNDRTNETASFIMKISLVGKEIIDKQTYFWKELNITSFGVIIKRLTNLTTGKVKKCIFQRRGDQPVEFDIAELSRQLDKPEDVLAKLLPVPSLSFFPEITEPTYRIVSREKIPYSFPQSHKKLQCERTNYEDLTQTLKLYIWTSIDIPITNIVKSEVITKKISSSIKLLDFGLTGASSQITTHPVKFGEIIPHVSSSHISPSDLARKSFGLRIRRISGGDSASGGNEETQRTPLPTGDEVYLGQRDSEADTKKNSSFGTTTDKRK